MANFAQFAPIFPTKATFPIFSHQSGQKLLRMTRNGQFHLIHNFSNLFFPLKWLRMTRNGQFCLNCNFSQSFPTEVAQNDLEWPILPDSQLFQSFPTKVAQNDSEWNGQFHLIHNFSNLLPPKWFRMTRNGQFCLIHNFSHQNGSE